MHNWEKTLSNQKDFLKKSTRFIILKSTLKKLFIHKTTNLQKHRSAALFSGINDKISLSVV